MKIKAVNIIFIASVFISSLNFAGFAQSRPKSNVKNPKPNIVVELKADGFDGKDSFILGRKKNKKNGVGGGRVYATDFPSPNDKIPEGVWHYEITASISKDLNDKVIIKLKLLIDEETIKDFVTVKTNKVTEVEYEQGVKLKLYFEEPKEENAFN